MDERPLVEAKAFDVSSDLHEPGPQGRRVPMVTLFRYTTVRCLAHRLSSDDLIEVETETLSEIDDEVRQRRESRRRRQRRRGRPSDTTIPS